MNPLAAARTGQRRAESLMLDTCTIRRKTGTTFNETTGQYVDTFTTVYTGKCRVQQAGNDRGEEVAGGREVGVLSTSLHLPFTVATVNVDDVATVDASHDPALVGRELRVQQLMYGTLKMARRLPVQDVTA